MAEKHQTIIIGGGPAGLTAAIYLRRAGYEVLVLEKEEEGGQIRISESVVNYPGIIKIDGQTLMENMRRQAVQFGAQVRRETVISASLTDHVKVIQTQKNHYEASVVIYAAGSVPRKLDFPGESAFMGKGIAYCATCDGELFAGKPIFVVGGGYAAAEEALYLTRYTKPIVLIVREPDLTCAKKLADMVKEHPDIKIEYNTEIIRVEGDTSVKKIIFKNALSGKEWTYENTDTIGVFIFAGYLPQTAIVKKQLVCDQQGYLITDDGKRTNVEGVYGAGDVCQKRLRQLVTAVADGAVAAETIVADYPLEQLPVIEEATRKNKTGASSHVSRQDALIQNVSKQIQGKEEKKIYTGKGEGAIRPDSPFSEIYSQIKEVERRFETIPVCRVFLDDSQISQQVREFMEDLREVMPSVPISYEEKKAEDTAMLPFIDISSKDQKKKGIYFHGTPGGHEFSSFLSALYQAAGPGKTVTESIYKRLQSLSMPVRMDIGMTLNCTKCPELVTSAILAAAFSPKVEVHIINLAQFSAFKEKHQVYHVPFLLVNQKKTYYGKKNVEELIEIIENTQREENA